MRRIQLFIVSLLWILPSAILATTTPYHTQTPKQLLKSENTTTYTFTIAKGDLPPTTSISDLFYTPRPAITLKEQPCCTILVHVNKTQRRVNPGFTIGIGDGNGCYIDFSIMQYGGNKTARLNETTQCNGTFEQFKVILQRVNTEGTHYSITIKKGQQLPDERQKSRRI